MTVDKNKQTLLLQPSNLRSIVLKTLKEAYYKNIKNLRCESFFRETVFRLYSTTHLLALR